MSFRACNLTDEDRIQIALGLIAMRKAGVLRAVYIDGGRVSVYSSERPWLRCPLSWEAAERRVEEFYRARPRPSGLAQYATIRAAVAG